MVFTYDPSTGEVKRVDLRSLLVSQPNVQKTERACLVSNNKKLTILEEQHPRPPETVHIHACAPVYTHKLMHVCMHTYYTQENFRI